ncbi:hypothetical protein AZ014_000929, partial [Klebsiella pneumoniae]
VLQLRQAAAGAAPGDAHRRAEL